MAFQFLNCQLIYIMKNVEAHSNQSLSSRIRRPFLILIPPASKARSTRSCRGALMRSSMTSLRSCAADERSGAEDCWVWLEMAGNQVFTIYSLSMEVGWRGLQCQVFHQKVTQKKKQIQQRWDLSKLFGWWLMLNLPKTFVKSLSLSVRSPGRLQASTS